MKWKRREEAPIEYRHYVWVCDHEAESDPQ